MFKFLTRSTAIARHSIARQKMKIPPHLPYKDDISNLLENKIFHSLSNSLCGVHVFYHPSRFSARSIYLESLNNLMESEKINGALIATVRKNELVRFSNPWYWFKAQFVSENESSSNLSNLLRDDDRVAVVIDGLEEGVDVYDPKLLESFVVSLAENSVLTKRYTVLLCLNTEKFYRETIMWNGGAKICPVHYWGFEYN